MVSCAAYYYYYYYYRYQRIKYLLKSDTFTSEFEIEHYIFLYRFHWFTMWKLNILVLACICGYLSDVCNGAQKTVHRKLKKTFSGVLVDGPFVVTVVFGEEEEVMLSGQDTVIQSVQTRVSPEGTLTIRFKPDTNINDPGNIQIQVTAKAVTSLVASSNSQLITQSDFTAKNNLAVASYGSSQIIMQGTVTTSSFSAVVSTSSSLVAAVAVETANVVASGTSGVTLTGTADNANIAISDSSQFHGGQLVVQFLSASVSGKAKAELNSMKELKVSVSQSGMAITSGSAKVVKEIKDKGTILHQDLA
ncbi:uncharacterized protein LOC129580920 [Paramacrobiotus metropolitanus]|uniref:uncharacterized protein LOC129580920 n=1 Tax=Paramacrobiotus metropolitanus TaxID=2943436 RepID=UPI0024456E22|nr:uncharacterized protein LOC129580920 [Paramacrobiotus metropolitanus]